jgi:calcium permeable stress-gated cation channel
VSSPPFVFVLDPTNSVMYSDLKELPAIYDRRLAACNKLESAETSLLRTAAKIRLEAGKDKSSTTAETADPERDTSLAERLVPRDQRPTHRLPLGFMPFGLPFIGQKVDSIEWAREQIRVCGELLEKGREVVNQEDSSPEPDTEEKGEAAESTETQTYPKLNSAFVTFHSQIAAHLALQVLSHHDPYQMSGKWGEMSPSDVIWGNLGMDPYQQKVNIISVLIHQAA